MQMNSHLSLMQSSELLSVGKAPAARKFPQEFAPYAGRAPAPVDWRAAGRELAFVPSEAKLLERVASQCRQSKA